MHNREGITMKMMWKALKDYDLWLVTKRDNHPRQNTQLTCPHPRPLYIIALTFHIPSGPPDQYLTLTLRHLGFDKFNTNLLSIPPAVFLIINMMLMTYVSEKVNQRAYMGVATQLWVLPCVIALLILPLSTENPWTTYGILVTLLSHPSPHPLQVGWCSRISGSVRTRTVSAALYNMFVQLQGIVVANIYRDDDKPDYRKCLLPLKPRSHLEYWGLLC
jgi:hypothetical protein